MRRGLSWLLILMFVSTAVFARVGDYLVIEQREETGNVPTQKYFWFRNYDAAPADPKFGSSHEEFAKTALPKNTLLRVESHPLYPDGVKKFQYGDGLYGTVVDQPASFGALSLPAGALNATQGWVYQNRAEPKVTVYSLEQLRTAHPDLYQKAMTYEQAVARKGAGRAPDYVLTRDEQLMVFHPQSGKEVPYLVKPQTKYFLDPSSEHVFASDPAKSGKIYVPLLVRNKEGGTERIWVNRESLQLVYGEPVRVVQEALSRVQRLSGNSASCPTPVVTPLQKVLAATLKPLDFAQAPAFKHPNGHQEPQVFWNECAPTAEISAQFAGMGCSQQRSVSQALMEFMEKNFSACVGDGLRQAHGVKPENARKIHLVHNGIAGDPRHSPKSYHALRRAIDVKEIQVVSAGKNYAFSYEDASEATRKLERGIPLSLEEKRNVYFWNQFRSCWKDRAQANGCSYTGAVGNEDPHHQHHLHLSVPFCPKNSNFMFSWIWRIPGYEDSCVL